MSTHPAIPAAHAPLSPMRTSLPAPDRAMRCELPALGAAGLGLSVEPRATVTVTGWDDERVVVQAGPDGAGPAAGVEIVSPPGEGVTIWAHVYDVRPEAGVGCALRIDVRVPRRFAVTLSAPRSTVLVTCVDGPVTRGLGQRTSAA